MRTLHALGDACAKGSEALGLALPNERDRRRTQTGERGTVRARELVTLTAKSPQGLESHFESFAKLIHRVARIMARARDVVIPSAAQPRDPVAKPSSLRSTRQRGSKVVSRDPSTHGASLGMTLRGGRILS